MWKRVKKWLLRHAGLDETVATFPAWASHQQVYKFAWHRESYRGIPQMVCLVSRSDGTEFWEISDAE